MRGRRLAQPPSSWSFLPQSGPATSFQPKASPTRAGGEEGGKAKQLSRRAASPVLPRVAGSILLLSGSSAKTYKNQVRDSKIFQRSLRALAFRCVAWGLGSSQHQTRGQEWSQGAEEGASTAEGCGTISSSPCHQPHGDQRWMPAVLERQGMLLRKEHKGVWGARQPSCRQTGRGTGSPSPRAGCGPLPARQGCSATKPRGAEAVLSPVIDGTVQEEINSQAFAGGELGGVSIFKILNECATARGVAADTSLQPALPTLFIARFRHNLTASY